MKYKDSAFTIFVIIVFSMLLYLSLTSKDRQLHNINCRQAYEDYYLNRSAMFIDVREEYFYREKHIQNSINIPMGSFISGNKKVKSTLKKISKKKLLITYCDSKNCSMSEIVGNYLIRKGYKNIRILTGGIEEWENNGFPISKNNL
jgi:rhodanese-related sulfurtransferase